VPSQNLGVHSTQRNESYYVVVKAKLHKHLPISKAVHTITAQTAQLGRKYDAEINRNRRSLPRLLDKKAFATARSMLTHYALNIVMREWSTTKLLADQIENGLETLNFKPGTKCQSNCELPLRYGLPCKHWLYKAFIDDVPIPISLFHPRWLLDGLESLPKGWNLSWNPTQIRVDAQQKSEDRHIGDRYARRGEDLIMEAALATIEKHRSLPAGQAENFASKFKLGTDKLAIAQDKLTASHDVLPATLPEPLVEPNVRQFPIGRKRAMTGREAAEEQERDEARQRRRAGIQAQADHDENSYWAAKMVADIKLRHSQHESQTQLVPETQLSKTPSAELSSSEESSSSSDEGNDGEPRRSGRVKRPSRKEASQLSQDQALALALALALASPKAKGKGMKVRKAKTMSTSQLLDEFSIE
jgi:hypothetical protein